MSLTLAQQFAIWVLPVLFAITLHEVAHGWVASKRGDLTAKILGRLTINPLKHIDPIGTVLVPSLLFFLGGFMFGWAKPVPVDPRNLYHPRRDMMLIAVAGPFSNILMAFMWAGIAKIAYLYMPESTGLPVFLMGKAGVAINCALAILNILPIPPLDGGKVLMNLLPQKYNRIFAQIELSSFFILAFLALSGILGKILAPIYYNLQLMIFAIFGLN